VTSGATRGLTLGPDGAVITVKTIGSAAGATTIEVHNATLHVSDNVDLFAGTVRGVRYADEVCELSIVDKFQQLSDRKIGTTSEPVSYIGSSYLPSDLAWWAVTSYGGYDTTASSANTDIDYTSFQAWAAIFSGDSVFMEAQWKGQKITEALRKIARQTNSAIFIDQNKLRFERFVLANSNVSSVGPSNMLKNNLDFDVDDIINRQFVAGGYVPGSDHAWSVLDVSTSSVNSFGAKDDEIRDQNLWYVNSASALNLAQRLILSNAEPDDTVSVTTGLLGLPRILGETVLVNDPFHSLSESYRILGQTIDLNKGLVEFTGDRTQFFSGFILNTSSLNGSDVLT